MDDPVSRVRQHLLELCRFPDRALGRVGNQAATTYFAHVAEKCGWAVELSEFDCMDWVRGDVDLTVGDESFDALAGPYSLGCDLVASLAAVSTVEELERVEVSGQILLLHGPIAVEQLMPKNFPFYNPDHHRQLVGLLETKQPAAIIAATGRNPELAGGLYPFPLIEDGDFHLPSVYMKDVTGDLLARHAGAAVRLISRAQRIPATGYNVIARRDSIRQQRLLFCAHIDGKEGTPGALDNAGGVAVLLLLAELLAGRSTGFGLELVAFNGEDYYAAPGQILYLQQNRNRLGEIVLATNLDAAGYRDGSSAFSLYGCPQEIESVVHAVFASHPELQEGEPWYQSDHAIFVQNGVPAMAITSQRFVELSTYITHTPQDRPELVDSGRLARIGLALRDVVLALDRSFAS